MTEPAPAASPEFENFFRGGYRKVLVAALSLGATMDEAEEAAASAMMEVFRRWDEITEPLAYARKAARSNFVKQRTRTNKLVSHLIEYREVTTWYHDPGLTRWEDAQWVRQLLEELPPAQRDAMAGLVDDFSPAEIGRLLGKDPAAIRQNLRAARQRLEAALGERPGRGPGIRPLRRPREDR